MQFLTRWVAPHRSAVVEAVLEAADEAALRARLTSQGAAVLSVAAPRRAAGQRIGKGFDAAWWCRELATLLRAGMSVVEAIETLRLQATRAGGGIQTRLLTALHEGQSLSAAMSSAGVFPQVLIASVFASERTSRLADALDDFLQYDRQLKSLRRQVASAAVYPAVVVGVGLLIAVFLLTFVMPRFARMLGTFHGELSPLTRLMLWFSGVLTHSLPVAVTGVLAAVALVRFAFAQGRGRRWGGRLLDRLPPTRRAREHFARAKLFQALMLTLRGGYTLVDALHVCERLGLAGGLDAALAQAREDIERGQPASGAFDRARLVDVVGERLLRVGERSGQFEPVLRTLTDRHAEAFSVFVQRATRLVEPLLLLGVAVMVGGIVILMYLPIFDIANGLK
ncbi:MAG: type II secretion system F family protein [Burkholderiaceae bacterium]